MPQTEPDVISETGSDLNTSDQGVTDTEDAIPTEGE